MIDELTKRSIGYLVSKISEARESNNQEEVNIYAAALALRIWHPTANISLEDLAESYGCKNLSLIKRR